MSWTKKQFIVQAYEEIGMANYVFDLQPEQLQSAARRLDAMMAFLNAKNILVGYPIAANPENVDIDTETNIPDAANQAVYMSLAVLLAPGLGKVLPPEVKAAAKAGIDVLAARNSRPNFKRMPGGWPRGAGTKAWRRGNTFTQDPGYCYPWANN